MRSRIGIALVVGVLVATVLGIWRFLFLILKSFGFDAFWPYFLPVFILVIAAVLALAAIWPILRHAKTIALFLWRNPKTKREIARDGFRWFWRTALPRLFWQVVAAGSYGLMVVSFVYAGFLAISVWQRLVQHIVVGGALTYSQPQVVGITLFAVIAASALSYVSRWVSAGLDQIKKWLPQSRYWPTIAELIRVSAAVMAAAGFLVLRLILEGIRITVPTAFFPNDVRDYVVSVFNWASVFTGIILLALAMGLFRFSKTPKS